MQLVWGRRDSSVSAEAGGNVAVDSSARLTEHTHSRVCVVFQSIGGWQESVVVGVLLHVNVSATIPGAEQGRDGLILGADSV